MPVDHHTASYIAEFRRTEHFTNFGKPKNLLSNFRFQQTTSGNFHVIDSFVNDTVVSNVYTGLSDRLSCCRIGTDVKSNHCRLRGGGELNI